MSTSVGRFPRIVLSLLAVAAAVYPFNRPDEQVVASPGEIGREQGAGLTPPQTRPRLPPPGSVSNANSPRSLASWSRNRLAGTLERSVLAVGVARSARSITSLVVAAIMALRSLRWTARRALVALLILVVDGSAL